MTSISVALRKENLGMEIAAGVLVRMRLIVGPDGSPPPEEWSWSGSVPMGQQDARRVDLRGPGVYEVELVLPSGRILREQREVGDGQSQEVLFSSGGSPHEWLSWQELTGGVQNRARYRPPTQAGEQTGNAASDLSPLSDGGMPDDLMLGGAPVDMAAKTPGFLSGILGGLFKSLVVGRDQQPGTVRRLPDYGGSPDEFAAVAMSGAVGPAWEALDDLSQRRSASAALDALRAGFKKARVLPSQASSGDDRSKLWRLRTEEVRAGERAFAAVGTRGVVEVASLPAPWRDAADGDPAEVEVFLDTSDAERAFRMRIVVRDPFLGGLLAYLVGGNLQAARIVLEDAVRVEAGQALFVQSQSPLAAAAAGYVVLATERDDRSQFSGDWFQSLMMNHPWMPDGAILFARWKLRFAQRQADVDIARDALREAYSRGLPFFAAGVDNFADALVLAADRDAVLGRMVHLVAAARTRVDPSQAFTVFKLG